MKTNLVINLRPRSPWEAADLGIVLVRQWWTKLYLVWFFSSLPLFLVALLVVGPVWAAVIVWWFKPLLERPLLFFLGRAVFDNPPGVIETLRAFPGLLKTQWFSWLTWRRLSASRSFLQPIGQLEGMNGKARAERIRVLRNDSVPSWLTIILLHLESALIFSFYGLIILFMPEGRWEFGAELISGEAEWVQACLVYLVIGIVAPCYVSCGFCLYLNRRIWLEGWDIEQGFRRILGRHNSCAALILLGILSVSSFSSTPVMASTPALVSASAIISAPVIASTPEEARADILRVIESEDFHQVEVQKYPDFIENWSFDWNWLDDSTDNDSDLEIAGFLEVLLWIVAFAAAVWMIYQGRRSMQLRAPTDLFTGKPELATTVAGLNIRENSLPENVPEQVKIMLQQGDIRAGLALLYRASLSRLVGRYGLRLLDGYTEGDCLGVVEGSVKSNLYNYFSQLTRLWIQAAYSHRLPEASEIHQLLPIWTTYFEQVGDVGQENSE